MLYYPTEVDASSESGAEIYSGRLRPIAPEALEDTGLPATLIEDLILKLLLARGVASGRDIAEAMCLSLKLIYPVLADLKTRMFVAHKTTAALGDFYYALTDFGRQTAMVAKDVCAYSGAAPVMFADYLESVKMQSIRNESPTVEDLRRAYADLVVDDKILATLGPAIHSGRGLFLFGEPGNGKTSLAERIRDSFRDDIYIPRALWIEGDLIQLYDPQAHEIIPEPEDDKVDSRWVRIKRPTVIVGGELTMEALDIRYNPTLKVSEAPLQMKANGGVFLIDDFGRQRIDHADLLNRWIVPLEKQYDYLMLTNGKKIQVPFDQLIIFSTNLNPADLVDEAFLRRIPYKIEIPAPNEAEFRKIFQAQCVTFEMTYDDSLVTELIARHYTGIRPFRACQPRDLLNQVRHMCTFFNRPSQLSMELLEQAVKNYFSAMGQRV